MKSRGIEGPAFGTDALAKRALTRAVNRDAAQGYTITEGYSRETGPTFCVIIKSDYWADAQGLGRTLRVAAHRALCSAGLR